MKPSKTFQSTKKFARLGGGTPGLFLVTRNAVTKRGTQSVTQKRKIVEADLLSRPRTKESEAGPERAETQKQGRTTSD